MSNLRIYLKNFDIQSKSTLLSNILNHKLTINRHLKKILYSDKKLKNPSANRNQQPILDVLHTILNGQAKNLELLEISSGTGQHSAYFANDYPNITFQPSEYDVSMLTSIKSYADDSTHRNVKNPIYIDIKEDFQNWEHKFPEKCFDYMLNINMIHISPWECTQGLFRNASKLLKDNGLLITYGPYAVNGSLVPESNVSFNKSLRSRNPEWGVRDIKDLKELAGQYGIVLKQSTDMPSNNKTLVWQNNSK